MSDKKICDYCSADNTIDNSHVVPNFVGKYIKENSSTGKLLNSWERKPQQDIFKGKYLCEKCDNEVFSSWEKEFANTIWRDPEHSEEHWNNESTIKFILSLAYRYALHFLETSPMPKNRAYTECVRSKTLAALKDSDLVGKEIFIYPYVFQPIVQDTKLIPGINHFLNLAIHGQSLPKENDYPNAFLIVIPRMMFLICDSDLSDSSAVSEIIGLNQLMKNGEFFPLQSNTNLPEFIYPVLNGYIGGSQGHQKDIRRWDETKYKSDEELHPDKVCYQVRKLDSQLFNWKRKSEKI